MIKKKQINTESLDQHMALLTILVRDSGGSKTSKNKARAKIKSIEVDENSKPP